MDLVSDRYPNILSDEFIEVCVSKSKETVFLLPSSMVGGRIIVEEFLKDVEVELTTSSCGMGFAPNIIGLPKHK